MSGQYCFSRLAFVAMNEIGLKTRILHTQIYCSMSRDCVLVRSRDCWAQSMKEVDERRVDVRSEARNESKYRTRALALTSNIVAAPLLPPSMCSNAAEVETIWSQQSEWYCGTVTCTTLLAWRVADILMLRLQYEALLLLDHIGTSYANAGNLSHTFKLLFRMSDWLDDLIGYCNSGESSNSSLCQALAVSFIARFCLGHLQDLLGT